MFKFIFVSFLFNSLSDEAPLPPETIDDLKPGQCLTFEDMQKLGGVFSKDVYLAGEGKCSEEYSLDGEISDSQVCIDPVVTGSWERKIAEHKKWGMWWPSRPPCFTSVTEAAVRNVSYTRVLSTSDEGEGPVACMPDDIIATQIQEESFKTKYWEVGEGEMYLPDPLLVRTEDYAVDPVLGSVLMNCRIQQLKVSYKGWGSFESKWWRYSCGQEKPERCRVARMKASETESGDTCILIRQIDECDQATYEQGRMVSQLPN